MGDPKFSRRRYVTPSHPWQGERIAEENELIRKYGLKNKTELWKVQSLLRRFRQRARQLQAKVRYGDVQAENEREELLKRLARMGLLGDESSLDDVLGLNIEDILARRLQTMTYLKGLSGSSKQARQFIVHGHIGIGDRKVTIPGYYVKRGEEEQINYLTSSPISHDLHPARPKEEGELETDVPIGEAVEKEGEAPKPEEAGEPAPTAKDDEKPAVESPEGEESKEETKPPKEEPVEPEKERVEGEEPVKEEGGAQEPAKEKGAEPPEDKGPEPKKEEDKAPEPPDKQVDEAPEKAVKSDEREQGKTAKPEKEGD